MKIIVYEPYAGTTVHFRQVGMIERIISLTWTPKGADVGVFSLVIPFSQEAMGLFQINRLVQKMEETDSQYAEPMIILHREISISQGTQKEILKIEGKSMLEALKWRLCNGASVPAGAQPPAAWALRACNYNVDTATFYNAGIRIAYESADVEAVEAVFEEMSVVLDNVLNLMQTYGLFTEISVYGYAREGDVYGITRVSIVFRYEKDQSLAQAENPVCVYGAVYHNVLEESYEENGESERTVALVRHDGITTDIPGAWTQQKTCGYIAKYDASVGVTPFDGIKQLMVSASGAELVSDDDTFLTSECIATLTALGKAELTNNRRTKTVTITPQPDVYPIFGKDYNIGSKISYVNERWGIRIDGVVSEATNTFEGSTKKLELVIGSQNATMLRRVRQIQKSGGAVYQYGEVT